MQDTSQMYESGTSLLVSIQLQEGDEIETFSLKDFAK